MSGKLMGQVYGLKLTPAKRDVLMAMAENADDDGNNCRPGVPLIAWKIDKSERQVQRVQKALIVDGLLVVVDTPPRRPIVYRIVIAAGTPKAAYVPRSTGMGDIAVSPKTEANGDTAMSPMSAKGDTQMSPITPIDGDTAMSPLTELRVTSHGKNESPKGDIGTGKTASNQIQREPRTVQKQQQQQNADEPNNAFALYERNIGVLTPLIADALKGLLKDYPPEWVDDAIRETALSGGKSPNYVSRVLERWTREGRNTPRPVAASPAAAARASPPRPQRDPALAGFDARQMVNELERSGKNDKGWNPFADEAGGVDGVEVSVS